MRTPDKKYRSKLTEMRNRTISLRAPLERSPLGSLHSHTSKSGHILVRTLGLKFDTNYALYCTCCECTDRRRCGTLRQFGTREKSGQFSVRTHVRKTRQNLRKLRGMSGDLNLGHGQIKKRGNFKDDVRVIGEPYLSATLAAPLTVEEMPASVLWHTGNLSSSGILWRRICR